RNAISTDDGNSTNVIDFHGKVPVDWVPDRGYGIETPNVLTARRSVHWRCKRSCMVAQCSHAHHNHIGRTDCRPLNPGQFKFIAKSFTIRATSGASLSALHTAGCTLRPAHRRRQGISRLQRGATISQTYNQTGSEPWLTCTNHSSTTISGAHC